MAEKQPIIVIKKVNVQAAGHHGGSWKVAFADFMTAMMAFFLVMWLISQSEEVKKNVSDYFSTPSIIEYSFSNYGVELTLEKLFLDLINEPLKFFESFVRPIDRSPNVMTMGTKKIAMHFMAEMLGDLEGTNVEIFQDEIVFEVPESLLFVRGTAKPKDVAFVSTMAKVTAVTKGLEDTDVFIDSVVPFQRRGAKGLSLEAAREVASQRLELVALKVRESFEVESVELQGRIEPVEDNQLEGKMRFRLKQREYDSTGKPTRKLEEVFGKKDDNSNVYDSFVRQAAERKAQAR